MDVPYICAGEDFLKIAIVHHLLRRSGAFFMRRSFKNDLLYKTIFKEYVTAILI
jgi:glycerol-3-phosphate O-acyltransferase